MGLFDFLHWNDEESEAEAYMRERNKTYAKRAAQYKKQQESFDNSDDFMNVTTEKYTRPDGTKVTSKTYSKGYVNGKPSGKVGDLLNQMTGGLFDDINDINKECENQNLTEAEKQAILKERLRGKYGNAVRVDSSSSRSTIKTTMRQHDDCVIPSVKQEELSIFVVKTARRVGPVWKVCGEIIRGRFGFGDTVVVKNSIAQKVGEISKIIRQGEGIEYANASSGIIVMDVKVNGFEINPGDKLTKDSIS